MFGTILLIAVHAANEHEAHRQFAPVEFVMAKRNEDHQDRSFPIQECCVADGDASPERFDHWIRLTD